MTLAQNSNPKKLTVQRVLISLTNKEELLYLATELEKASCEVYATTSTYAALQELQVAPQEMEFGKKTSLKLFRVENLTGFPEILGGRVKTLHPKIFGGILANKHNPVHLQELQNHSCLSFDLVVCNLYSFQQAAKELASKKPFFNLTDNEKYTAANTLIEKIDIGGVTLLRAAAKNFENVAVLCDPADYKPFFEEMNLLKGSVSMATCLKLSLKAFKETAAYDSAIAETLALLQISNQNQLNSQNSFELGPIHSELNKNRFSLQGTLKQKLRYGENPHQQANFYSSDNTKNECSLATANCLHGKELSYNNMLDIDHSVRLSHDLSKLSQHSCVIVKHNSPCGVALSNTSAAEAFQKAFQHDTVSPFGGIVTFHSSVTAEAAMLLSEIFLEVIVAPSFAEEALEILQRKKNVRLVELNTALPLAQKTQIVSVQGGFLTQDADLQLWNNEKLEWKFKLPQSEKLMPDAIFGMTIVKHLKSNAIAVVKHGVTLAVAGGFTNRVDAVRSCVEKILNNSTLQNLSENAVLASDAFFPFPDNVEVMSQIKLGAVVQPGGSVQDEAVIEACKRAQIPLLLTAMRHFKH